MPMDRPKIWQRLTAFFIYWLFAGAIYFIAPKLAVGEFTPVFYTAIDELIPFWSWSIIIYLPLYILHLPLNFAAANSWFVLSKLFYTYVITALILGGFFVFFPTTIGFPPAVEQPRDFFDQLWLWFRNDFDVPANMFPSAHVTYSLVGPIFLLAIGRRLAGSLLLVLGLAITISTLTLKQHNLWDVLAGIALAAILGVIFGRSARKYTLN